MNKKVLGHCAVAVFLTLGVYATANAAAVLPTGVNTYGWAAHDAMVAGAQRQPTGCQVPRIGSWRSHTGPGSCPRTNEAPRHRVIAARALSALGN